MYIEYIEYEYEHEHENNIWICLYKLFFYYIDLY